MLFGSPVSDSVTILLPLFYFQSKKKKLWLINQSINQMNKQTNDEIDKIIINVMIINDHYYCYHHYYYDDNDDIKLRRLNMVFKLFIFKWWSFFFLVIIIMMTINNHKTKNNLDNLVMLQFGIRKWNLNQKRNKKLYGLLSDIHLSLKQNKKKKTNTDLQHNLKMFIWKQWNICKCLQTVFGSKTKPKEKKFLSQLKKNLKIPVYLSTVVKSSSSSWS